MSGIFQTQTTSFKVELYQGFHAFDSTYRAVDTFMLALYTNLASLDDTTTVYTPGDLNEVVGTGYTAGGQVLTIIPPASSHKAAFLSFQNAVWTPAAFTCNSALIYNITQGNRAVCVLAFGNDKTCTTVFTVQMPVNLYNTALIRSQ